MRLGGRIIHPTSRKERLISPEMVGNANAANDQPRSTWYRCTALTNLTIATWVKSSSSSPRLR